MFSLAIEANPKNTTYLVFRATTHLYLKNYNGTRGCMTLTPAALRTAIT